MTFDEFEARRTDFLSQNLGMLDCSQTNLYRAMSKLQAKEDGILTRAGTFDRSHLALQWTQYFGLERDASRRVLVSCGVRHSLELIFAHCAANGANVWLPSDNYPVYFKLAEAAGLSVRTFPTLPQPQWPDEGVLASAEYILITNPIKPLSRWLSESDLSTLKNWLAASPLRRLIIDAVYDFGGALHHGTCELMSEGQTILLHSLTKGWLSPRLFGVMLVPDQDVATWLPILRSNAPPQSHLSRAQHLMDKHGDMPSQVINSLAQSVQRMFTALPFGRDQCQASDAEGYFFPIHRSWESLFEDQVLGLPASVFGSDQSDLTILTSLAFAK